MRNLDFSSWQALLSTLLGIAVITLIGVGIRLLAMQTIQQRRERENRQINERLRTLIAAYKTLGGSFTGDLAVDPTHLRDLRRAAAEGGSVGDAPAGSDRARRVRDAVEAALSDIILLGTEEQVRLATRAANELVEGRPVHTHELVVSLRDFVREALDLDPVPAGLALPRQGPARPGGGGTGGGRGKGDGDAKGGGGRGGGMGAGMGVGAGLGLGSAGLHEGADEQAGQHSRS
jgi:heme exporter protein D